MWHLLQPLMTAVILQGALGYTEMRCSESMAADMDAALAGSPAANVAEAKALLRFTSMHGQAETDVRAFSADVRAAVRDSMESLRSAALSNPSTRAPSLEDTRTVLLPALLHFVYICVYIYMCNMQHLM